MKARRHNFLRGSRNQRGAALVVALILLLVMTLLGVTAMNSSILQGFMSSSYRQQTEALATAENILRAGELDVEDLVAFGVGADRDAYYINLVTNPGDQFDPTAYAANWPANQFVIEYLGQRIIPGESIVIGGGLEDSLVHVFRVSAREVQSVDEREALRIVQSLYLTLDSPDE
ncbi:MAG: PilX N-terminal domain-containing pilus assembly protein [Gammaproteobacteria bacterium]